MSPLKTERVGDVLLTVESSVVHAILDRPKERNAINPGIVEGLQAAADLAETSRAKVLVVRGAGGNFSAGADLKYVRSVLDDKPAFDKYITRLGRVLDRLADIPSVSLAVVEGYALAGGCEMLLSCDLSIAANEAQIGDRHLELGLLPGAGGSVRLTRALSAAQSRYLLLTGSMIDGTTAERWGLVSQAVAQSSLDEAVDRILHRLAGRSGEALALAKQMLAHTRDRGLRDALNREQALFFDHMLRSGEVREGLAAFAERRAPRFGRPVHEQGGNQ